MTSCGRDGHVLIVDDDDGVRTLVAWQLEAEGFRTWQARDGVQALQALRRATPDLIVLDLSLPGVAGLDVLRQLRDGHLGPSRQIPVIVLSGRSGQTDRIVGLDQGADDYLVKPFSPGELAARVRSVLRRSRAGQDLRTVLERGQLRIDITSREVTRNGERIALTAKEFDLIAFLAANPRQVFTRTQLLAQVWQSSSNWQGAATVTEHIRRLRAKLECDASHPTMLRTVRNIGYQFDCAEQNGYHP